MANIKISELNPLVTIQDADVLPIVDNAVTKKVTAAILRSYTEGNSVLLTTAQTIAGIKTFTSQLASSVATGTAPFSVASTTKVTNLNADLLDGLSSADFALSTRTLTAGTGLTGGGDLTANRTFAIDSTVATLTGTQTLTNKTITSPVINEILDSNGNEILGFTPIASATDYITIKNGIGVGVPLHISAAGSSTNTGLHLEPKGSGLVQISDGTDTSKGFRFRSSGSAASAVTLLDAVSSAGRVITLPDATTTLVGTNTTDTLTNKSISGATNTLSNIGNASLTNSAITINGTSTSLGGSINVGTVTSVAALTLGTSGTDVSSTVATGTTTPVITLNVPTASASNRGALSSTDWSTFNAKQTAGNYITALTGEASASGPGSSSITLTNSAVIGKILTGLNVTGGSVSATDSIVDAFGKVQNQINSLIGGTIYKGTWNASTNTPTLTSSVGTQGFYYIVSVAGATNLNGITDWNVGDWAIFDGSAWQKVDNTDSVVSVNGLTGAVSLTTSNITEGTNLYYTEARVDANSNVAANTAARHNAVTLGTANGLSLSTQALSLGLASGSTTGALSSTDWTTFNNKQNALTNPITGTGTTNYLPKFTGASALGNSTIFDNGSNVYLNTTTGTYRFEANAGNSQYINARFYGSSHSMIQVESTTAGFQALIAHKSPTGEYSVGLQGDGRYAIYHNTGAAERFTITSAGLVGIGTTSPAYLLDVNGTAAIRGALTIAPTTNGVASSLIYSALGVGQNVSYGVGKALTSGNCAFFGWQTTGTNTGYVFMESFASASNLVLNTGGAGNVLINTTTDNSLGAKLQVSGGISAAGEILISQAADSGMRLKSGASNLCYIDFADANTGAPQGSITYNHIVDAIIFNGGGSNAERMRIKSNTINISNIPTSAVGLSAGDIYSNLGVLTIV